MSFRPRARSPRAGVRSTPTGWSISISASRTGRSSPTASSSAIAAASPTGSAIASSAARTGSTRSLDHHHHRRPQPPSPVGRRGRVDRCRGLAHRPSRRLHRRRPRRLALHQHAAHPPRRACRRRRGGRVPHGLCAVRHVQAGGRRAALPLPRTGPALPLRGGGPILHRRPDGRRGRAGDRLSGAVCAEFRSEGHHAMTAFRTLDQADVKGKRVLVRVDLNVPMADGKVADDTRIRAVAPTITEIADKGGKVILLAHFGRPKGGPEPAFSLKQVVPALVGGARPPGRLRRGLHRTDGRGRGRGDEGRRRPPPREHPLPQGRGEERAPSSSRRWPSSATSTSTTPSRPPTAPMPRPRGWRTSSPPMPAAPCRREIEALESALANPKRPVVAVIGGAKVSSQDRRPREPRRQGRRAGGRRRHGQHLPPRQGHPGRQVARRARPRRHRQEDHGGRRQGRLDDRAADRRRGGEGIQGRRRGDASYRSTPCPPTR